MARKTCPVCGKPVTRRTYCSRECAGVARQHYRACVECGKQFAVPPSSDQVCCSRACSAIHRSKLHGRGVYREATVSMLAAKELSPLLKPGPQHVNAKEWVIRSPDGQIYQCRNLMDWCRGHADLLDGTPRQAWDGLSKVKYSMQGKRKNPCKSWKGWTLLGWGE